MVSDAVVWCYTSKVATGADVWNRSFDRWSTSTVRKRRSRERETRLTNRPDGCRVTSLGYCLGT